MEVNDDLILKLEKLSRLSLNEEDRGVIKEDLKSILKMIDKLQEVDTEGVEPLVYLNTENSAWRKDEVSNELSQKQALKNAPATDEFYFTVPKVLKL